MTKSEYVRISVGERFFGQRNLLHSQLELLDSLKHFKAYKKLRKEEFALKVALKSMLEETSGILDKLDRTLPKTKYVDYEDEPIRGRKKKSVEPSLQDEIEEVKRKLGRLQRGW
jgi:hypothetical protein